MPKLGKKCEQAPAQSQWLMPLVWAAGFMNDHVRMCRRTTCGGMALWQNRYAAHDSQEPRMDVVVRRYGSATDFVVTFGRGTHRFTLDETLGEFIYVDQVSCLPMHFLSLFHLSTGNPDAAWHSSHNIHHSTHGLHGVHSACCHAVCNMDLTVAVVVSQMHFPAPDKCKKIYSVNEGNTQYWDEDMQASLIRGIGCRLENPASILRPYILTAAHIGVAGGDFRVPNGSEAVRTPPCPHSPTAGTCHALLGLPTSAREWPINPVSGGTAHGVRPHPGGHPCSHDSLHRCVAAAARPALVDIPAGNGISRIPVLPPSRYTSRYVGSMVSDVHRTILYGGIFLSGLEPASASAIPPAIGNS